MLLEFFNFFILMSTIVGFIFIVTAAVGAACGLFAFLLKYTIKKDIHASHEID